MLMKNRETDAVPARSLLDVEVLTLDGKAACVRFVASGDSIEISYAGRPCGSVLRVTLVAWLASAQDPLIVGSVVLYIDRFIDADGRIAIALPDVSGWPLSPSDQSRLVRRMKER